MPLENIKNNIVIITVLFFQFILAALTFPLSALGSGLPPLHIDHPFHLYQIQLGRELLQQGLLVGFDPWFAAGTPGGMTFNASARVPVLLSALFPASVSTASIYSFYVFFCALIAPAAIPLAVKVLKWPLHHELLAAAVGLAFWWIGPFRWYHTAGLVSFVCSSYLAILFAIWVFHRVLINTKTSFPTVILAGILGGGGLWLHPLFGIVAAIPLLAMIIVERSRLDLRTALSRSLTIGALAIAINLPWILAIKGNNQMVDQPYQRTVGLDFLANALAGVWAVPMGSFLNPLVVSLSVIGLFFLKPEVRRMPAALLATGMAFLLFAAFGGTVELLGTLQPNRFLAPGFLLIGLSAAGCLGVGISWLKSSNNKSYKTIAGIAMVCVAALIAREIVREATPGPHSHYGKNPPELTPPPSIVSWLEANLRQHTSPEGRILFETSLARAHGGGHMAGYLALQTQREFIGGPYPFFTPQRSFWDHVAFGKALSDMTSDQLTAGLNLYNVGWVVTHSLELSERIAELANAHLLTEKDGIRIYRINRPLSYFQQGNGRIVSRSANRVEISAGGGTDLILLYQWIPGLSTVPASSIEPVSLSPDFPPFIRIRNPPKNFILKR